MLELPALTTRIVSLTVSGPDRLLQLAMAKKGGYCARRQARPDIVRARGEDDRNACAEHDARRVGMREEGEILRQHVAGLKIRHDENLRLTGYRRFDPLDPRSLRADRVVEGKRTIELPARDLPAIGHLTQSRRLDRRWDACGHGLDGREDRDFRRAESQSGIEING